MILLFYISKVNEAYACEFTGYWTGYSCVFEEFCHTLLRSQQPSTNTFCLLCLNQQGYIFRMLSLKIVLCTTEQASAYFSF